MKVNQQNVELAFRGFQTVYNTAFEGTETHCDTIAMVVESSTSEENYGWLGQFPDLREWIGDRVLKQLASHGFKIVNKKYESTVVVPREDVEDDRHGVYRPMFSEMGRVGRVHPDKMLFTLLGTGFDALCYDGETFFNDAHPVSGLPGDTSADTLSNVQDGTGPAWYLLDLSRAVKPLIWQERVAYDLQAVTDPRTYSVVMSDEFIFAIRARVNAGLGLWQLAFASKAPLTPENYAAARAAMMEFTGDGDQLLGVVPTHLVVPPALEADGRSLLTAATVDSSSNVWNGSAGLIVTPYLR